MVDVSVRAVTAANGTGPTSFLKYNSAVRAADSTKNRLRHCGWPNVDGPTVRIVRHERPPITHTTERQTRTAMVATFGPVRLCLRR